MAVFITGDIHGNNSIEKFAPENFNAEGLTRDDYIIILGDFGLVWDDPPSTDEAYWLDWLEARPWTTLFIDGNHENFDLLGTFDVEPWHGGQVRRIREHVMHLARAEVFEIGGHSFFTLGGAYSTDKQWRTPFVTWWPQEVPDERVRALADAKVAEVGRVDYVLTHCPPAGAFYEMCHSDLVAELYVDEYNLWLQSHVGDKLEFKRWFFGHMHVDNPRMHPYTPLYDYIFDLDGTGRCEYGTHTDWSEGEYIPPAEWL